MVGWRKKKDTPQGKEIITEPVRKSLYDVLQTNLKIAKRANYIHRLLYMGEHKFPGTGIVVEAFEKNYKLTNTGYCTEYLSGLLLHYPTYFCCIVEGSEDVLHRHLYLLFDQEDENLDNVRLLSAVHHVTSRFLNEWMAYFARPQERVEEIDPESDMENSMRYVQECCERMYKFANAYVGDQLKLRAIMQRQDDDDEDDEEFTLAHRPTSTRSKSLVERDLYCDFIPELKLLQFLTQCKYLKTLKQYHHYYEYIGQSRDYDLKAWPAPKNFAPYDVFDEAYDPISDLPTQEAGKVEAGETRSTSTAASVRTDQTDNMYIPSST